MPSKEPTAIPNHYLTPKIEPKTKQTKETTQKSSPHISQILKATHKPSVAITPTDIGKYPSKTPCKIKDNDTSSTDTRSPHTTYHESSIINLPKIIAHILEQPLPNLQPTPWKFHRSIEAATYNTNMMKSVDFNMNTATQHPTNTALTYGSEFRPTSLIEPLLSLHPDWHKIKDTIENGVTYPLTPITEDDRLSDIQNLIERGNHKSALVPENEAALDKAFNKEVRYSWAIPILPSCITQIPGASVTPLGVAIQWSIDADNNRIIKRRTTHDCSFPGPSGQSCNKRVDKSLLDECRYGHALKRFLHGIHEMRLRHPHTTIWMNKTDLDAAYRRIHTNMQAAVTCITIIKTIAYLLLRLPFGSSPAPSKFSTVSDAIADVAQDLAADKNWDPAKLKSSFDLDFPPSREPEHIAYAPADELHVTLPARDICTDNFIDDLFQGCLDINDNMARIKHAVPLVLDTLFRPKNPKDSCLRDDIINMTKHKAEGKLEERKIILGWLIDTRRFRIFLTPHKLQEWQYDVETTIQKGHCTKEVLESLIGRFNHTSVIIHIGRYFLTRLRHRLRTASHKPKSAKITLKKWEIEDLHLWNFILVHLADTGVSINNVCFVRPSAITYSDACTWGLGGLTMQGHAWQYIIPIYLRGRASINVLEFLAAIVTIELSLKEDKHRNNHPHILAFTDNSSALGWMFHSTFNPQTHPHHDTMARHLARILFNHEATLFSEHIPGEANEVADSLSRDIHLSTPALTQLISSHANPEQVPTTFHISPLPPTTSSWIASSLQSMPQTTASPPKPYPSSLATSAASKTTSKNAASKTRSSKTTPHPKNNSSSPGTPIVSGTTSTKQQQKPHFSATLSKPPCRMWYRPSGKTFGLIPQPTKTGKAAP